jgi:quinol monooxygenase YgiN
VSVEVVTSFQALPGQAAELVSLLQEAAEISRAATGCESFQVFQRHDDDHKLLFLERWTSLDEHDDNIAHNIIESGQFMKILPLLVGPPDTGVIHLVG